MFMRRHSAKTEKKESFRSDRPGAIPARRLRDIAVRVKDEISEDNYSIIAAGVAFYGFLAIFPALAALVAIYGLVVDPSDLQRHMSGIEMLLPQQAGQLVNDELRGMIKTQSSSLGWSAVIATLIAIWSAANGMKAMFEAMNIAYDEQERRGFFRLNATAVLLTFAAIAFVIVFLGLIIGVPALFATIPLGETLATIIQFLRWLLLASAGILALGILYRYGPSREKPQWKWITWGAVIATAIWLVGSALFSFYVSHFSSYNRTYGSLGVVVILMTWLLLSAYSVLLGAKINAEMELAGRSIAQRLE
jgi:membrane protein